ncbi:hypothetical protein STCU_10358 [Strigomonas culicis]|uniref:Uncharacterized protein n=1 Tax=Strigomonas culicis TaxID=28005 RepID=S9TID3_9TRYP|nr:hypothetical protein STCU_10358 [Strigomonas culicis]|eukprot:EPY17867.1 hypothetical protein STCU_10358 [Strigomonas culicis]
MGEDGEQRTESAPAPDRTSASPPKAADRKRQKQRAAKKAAAPGPKATDGAPSAESKKGVAVLLHNLPYGLTKAELEHFLAQREIDVTLRHMERLPPDVAQQQARASKQAHWATYRVVVPTAAAAAAIVALFNHHDYHKDPEVHYLFGRTAYPFLQRYFPALLSATLVAGSARAAPAAEAAPASAADADVDATAVSKKNKLKCYTPHTALVIDGGMVPREHRWRDIKSTMGHLIHGDDMAAVEARALIKSGIELIHLDGGAADGDFYEKAYLVCKSQDARERVLPLLQGLASDNEKFATHVAYLRCARPADEAEEQHILQEITAWRTNQ